MRTLIVEAEWDAEANVWFATSDDVPGLAAEADTIDALRSKLEIMIPELLSANGALPEGVPDIPYELRSTGRAALPA